MTSPPQTDAMPTRCAPEQLLCPAPAGSDPLLAGVAHIAAAHAHIEAAIGAFESAGQLVDRDAARHQAHMIGNWLLLLRHLAAR